VTVKEDIQRIRNAVDLFKEINLGATAIGIYDLRVTPYSPNMAGIEARNSSTNCSVAFGCASNSV
jgi:aspartate ammonia-lyase